MPRPSRDYGLFFRREIAKQDAKLRATIAERRRLVLAYETITEDRDAFGPTDPLTVAIERAATLLDAGLARAARRSPRAARAGDESSSGTGMTRGSADVDAAVAAGVPDALDSRSPSAVARSTSTPNMPESVR